MSVYRSSSGSGAPEGMYAWSPAQSPMGWTGTASGGSSRAGAEMPARHSDSLTEAPDVRPSPKHELLFLEPFEGAPHTLEALEPVLKALHPDAMLSGRLTSIEHEWPSRPDVIRSELYMPQVPEDHPDYYLSHDGDNLAESTLHADGLVEFRVNLRTALTHLPRTYVGLDQLLHYNKKDRTLMLAPDVYVLQNTDIKPGDDVKSIRTWEHGVPVFVLELVSDSSLKNDLVHKLRVYAKVGVTEYVVWDPKGERIPQKLRYFRLSKGAYHEQKPERTPEGEPKIALEGLPVRLFCDGFSLRVQDPQTGEVYRGADEERALRQQACAREAEAVQREAEAVQREAEAVQREAEARLALEAQAVELQVLRALLAKLSPGGGG